MELNEAAGTVDDMQAVDRSASATCLTDFRHVVERLLAVLGLRDLTKTERVCKEWQHVASTIKKRRQFLQWVLFRQPSMDHQRNNFMLPFTESLPEAQDFFKSRLAVDPELAIVFAKLPQSRPCIGGNDLIAVKQLLPSHTTVLSGISSSGVIGTQCSAFVSKEYERPQLETISALFVPKFKNADVYHFALSFNTLSHNFRGAQETASDPESFSQLFGIPSEQTIKCLVLIAPSDLPFNFSQQIFNTFWLKENGRLAIAGGVANDCWRAAGLAPSSIDCCGLIGIAFCGAAVTAASLVIPETANSEKAVDRYLEDFKSALAAASNNRGAEQKTTTLAFMFACNGRGSRMHKQKTDVETTLFRKHFPTTPVVGMFAMGEVGLNFAAPRRQEVAENAAVSEEKAPDVLNSYTTCIALISIAAGN